MFSNKKDKDNDILLAQLLGIEKNATKHNIVARKDEELLARLLNSKAWQKSNKIIFERHKSFLDRKWLKDNALPLIGVIIAFATIIVSLIVPETRIWLGIDPNVVLPGKNVPVEEAIRLEYHYGSTENIILENPPKHSYSYYYGNNRDIIVPVHPSLSIDVVSQAEDEWIKIAPFAVVKVLRIDPITDTIYMHVPGIGGIGISEFFHVTLSPDQENLFGAPFTIYETYGPVPPNIDMRNQFLKSGYIFLKPGEREVFVSYFTILPGYFYRFKVGIPYTYKGIEEVKWVDKILVAAIPVQFKNCSGLKDAEFKCDDIIKVLNNNEMPTREGIRQLVIQDREMVYAERAFTWETVLQSIQKQKNITSTP